MIVDWFAKAVRNTCKFVLTTNVQDIRCPVNYALLVCFECCDLTVLDPENDSPPLAPKLIGVATFSTIRHQRHILLLHVSFEHFMFA